MVVVFNQTITKIILFSSILPDIAAALSWKRMQAATEK
jgi:hypothetical protein